MSDPFIGEIQAFAFPFAVGGFQNGQWAACLGQILPITSNTPLFSLIGTFANFDIVQIMTAGGPRNMTHMFATYSFLLGIRSGDLPLGAATSLFMLPILAVAAVFILRGVRKRGREIG